MQPSERHQFDVMIGDVTGRFAAQSVTRCDGRCAALRRLRTTPHDEGIRLAEYADTVFADLLTAKAVERLARTGQDGGRG